MKAIFLVTPFLFLLGCATMSEKPSTLNYEDAEKIKRGNNDQHLLDKSLQIVASKGSNCNIKMGDYLAELGARAHYFVMPTLDRGGYRAEYREYKIPFCKDYIMTGHLDALKEKAPSYYDSQLEYETKIKENFLEQSYNHLVNYLNEVDYNNSADLHVGLDAYKKIAELSLKYGKEACTKDAASKGCMTMGLFKKFPQEVMEKKNLNKSTKAYKLVKNFADEIAKSSETL